ncbi:MAG: isoprenylcysteine carboxylmethyltransferase family protein [Candidatus Omnitrophota bacterium]|jgi:protein-S-isoprenylcysteine O-methyltransferase Ste14
MKKRIKVNGIIMGLAFILVVVFHKIFLRQSRPEWTENFLVITGFLFLILGQLIRVCARGYKAERSQNSRALIEGGPYRIVRNPMYLGILFIGLGVTFIVFNWWATFIFLLVFALRYFPLTLSEEKKLRGMFPGTYEAYCLRVPRILPRISSLIKTSPKEYFPLKAVWFKKELNSIIPLLILVISVFLWRR